MANVFFALLLIAIVALIVGLIKPAFVIRWGEVKTKKRVLLIYGSSALMFFMLIGLTAPKASTEKQTAKANIVQEQPKNENQAHIKKRSEIAKQVTVEATPDYAIMDSKDNTKIGVLLKNNSDYRILKGSVTVRVKDAAGNTVDSGSLDFVNPIEAHAGSGGVLWLKAKRITSYDYIVNIKEFE